MARQFTRRLEHMVAVRSDDGGGGYSEEWQVRGALWCEVRMRSGDLRETEFGQTPRQKLRIVTRAVPQDHPARPWPGHRLRDGKRVYVVDAVHEGDAAGITLAILADEASEAEATT